MVGFEHLMASNVQLQPLPDFDFADPFIFTTEVIASVLALVAAFYFYRFYRKTGVVYLLGFVIGFSFITFAEVLLAMDVWLEFMPEIFNLFFWLRLLSLSYGFSFLALSYYYKRREDDRNLVVKIASLSVIPVMVMIAVIVLTPPPFDFPPYNQADQYFRVFNMIILAYIFKSTLGSIVEQGRKEFAYIPAAYAVLWLGQFSALIYSLDGGVSAFIAQHVAKVIALSLFVGVLSQVIRGKKVAKTETEV